MSRRLLLGAVPAVAGPIIFWLLLRNSGLSAAELMQLAVSLRPAPVLLIIVATVAHVALAGEKWRLVEARFAGVAPERRDAVLYSAIGTALGQFLPPPLANAAIRGAGNRFARGGGARRGALTSVWEQLFDLGVCAVMCAPAALGLVLLSPRMFLVSAAVAAVAADVLVGPVVAWGAKVARLPTQLHDRRLAQQLYRLSLARFAILVLITLSVVWAIGSSIEPLQLASIIAPVAVGSMVSCLPAGLGVNEWSFVALLAYGGVPFAVAALFAIANRLLVGSAALLVGLGAALAFGARRARPAFPTAA